MFWRNFIFFSITILLMPILLCLSIANAVKEDEALVGYWPMDEGKGGIVGDASGTGNDGTIKGGVSWVEGVEGTALEFDGTSGWVDCGADPSLFTIKDKCTVMLWFKPTADIKPGDARQNILYQAGSPMFGFNISVNAKLSDIWKREEPGALVVWVNGPGDEQEFPQTPLISKRTSWTAGEWHHAAFVYDGSECRLYVDGNLEDSLPRQGSLGIREDRVLAIGGAGGPSRFFRGVVDEIYYYNHPLSSGEILAISGLAVEPGAKLASVWGAIKVLR